MEILDLWPLFLGTYPALFAAGWAIGSKRAEAEAKRDMEAWRHFMVKWIDSVKEAYGVSGPVVAHINRRDTEH